MKRGHHDHADVIRGDEEHEGNKSQHPDDAHADHHASTVHHFVHPFLRLLARSTDGQTRLRLSRSVMAFSQLLHAAHF